MKKLILALAFLLGTSSAFAQGRSCSGQAPISITAASSGTYQIVAGAANQNIRIGHVSFSASTAVNVTFVSGTGANCATGTNNLSGAFQNLVTFSLTPGANAGFTAGAGNSVCMVVSGAVTLGGIVTWTNE